MDDYRNLFKNSPFPIFIYDLETFEILDVNQAAVSYYGYSQGEFLALTIKNFIPEDEISKAIAAYSEVGHEETDVDLGIFTHKKKDGKLIRVSLSGSPIEFQDRRCMMAVYKDMGIQNEENETLEFLKRVVAYANYGIMITSIGAVDESEPEILSVNREFTRMTGYTSEEVIGKPYSILHGPKSDKDELKKLSSALLNKDSCQITTINYKKGGAYFWNNCSISPIEDANGRFSYWMFSMSDVSTDVSEQAKKNLWFDIGIIFKLEESLRDSLVKVCKCVADYGDFSFCEIWIPTIHKNKLRLTAKYGKDREGGSFYQNADALKEMEFGEGLPGAIWNNEETTFWGNIDQNPFFIRKAAAQESGIHAVLCIPLKYEGGIVGILVLGTVQSEKEIENRALGLTELEDFLGSEIHRKRKEEEFKNMFETLPDILCVTDLEGRFLKMNKAGCNLLGYAETEIVGSTFHKFLHPEDKEVSDNIVKDIGEGKNVFRLENRYITKSGKVIWLNWLFKIVAEEGISYATAKNRTEAKKLEEVVTNASRLAKTGGWEIDVLNDHLYWSEGVHKIHETDPDTFHPILWGGLEFYREDFKERVKRLIENTINTGEPFNFEAALVTANKKEKWVRAIGHAEMVNGKCVRIYGSFQDITDLKETEHRLQAISNDLPGVSFQYYLYPDGTDRMDTVSQKSLEIWNLTPQQCEEDSQPIWDQIRQGGDYERLMQEIHKSVETLSQWHCRWRHIFPDGRICWHEGYGTPHRMPDGTILFNSIIFDITEGVMLTKLHKETTELAKMGSWEHDFLSSPNQDFMYWSPEVRKILEVDENYDASFSGGLEFYAHESRTIIEKSIEELVETGREFDIEVQLTLQSGKGKWVRAIGKSDRVNGICTKIYGSFQDIHSMKTTQLQLKEILGSISDAFYAVDKDWNFTYFNKEAENLLGKKSEEVLGKNIWEQFPPAEGTLLETLYRRVSETGKSETFEYNYPGTGSWYEVNTYPSNGGISAYFRNIDEKKNAALKLQSAYDEKNRILESIGDAFFTFDKDWMITYWNRQAEQLTGIERTSIVGKKLWEENPDTDDLKFYHRYQKAIETGNTVFFEEYYPALEKWFEVSAYPSGKGLSVYFKDVTLRKNADLQIQLANERFEKVTQATTDAIWDWDIVNKIVHRSNGFDKLFGDNVERSVSIDAFWKNCYHPSDVPKIRSSITKSLLDPTKEFWSREYRVVSKDKETKTVMDKGVIIRNEVGDAIRMVGAITDISERIKHEKALNELNKVLKNHIRNLEITNDQLEQFAFIASHDLQEPLRMITSFLNQLQRKYGGQLDDKADQYIHFATDGAKRMKQIILDLLEYSRAGKELGTAELIDLNSVINDYKVLRSRLINEKSVQIFTDDFSKVYCFKAPLVQTMHCLIDNAIKYTKEEEPPLIRISVLDKKSYWQVKIEDNGIGIDSRFFDKVFVIFQRLHDRDKYSGTGMGLSISKKNVESWGGKIWVESELGRGSAFYFTINKKLS